MSFLKSIARWLINQNLSNYIENIDASQFNLELTQGFYINLLDIYLISVFKLLFFLF